MNDIRIRSIDVASHKLDDKEPPNYGAMTVDVGGKEIRVFLDQGQVDRLVAAAEPIMREVLCEVSTAFEAGNVRIVA